MYKYWFRFSRLPWVGHYLLQFKVVRNSCDGSLLIQMNTTVIFEYIIENLAFKALWEIKTKADGCDKINIDMLLLCFSENHSYLYYIRNSCVEKNVSSDEWKVVRQIPLPKNRNASSFIQLDKHFINIISLKPWNKIFKINLKIKLKTKKDIAPQSIRLLLLYIHITWCDG